MFDFYIFSFCYVGTHVCYICSQYQPFWIASLFSTDTKVSRVWRKIDQGNCIKFCAKNYIKYARTFEMLTVAFGESTMNRTQVQLWYNRVKEGREDVNVKSKLIIQNG